MVCVVTIKKAQVSGEGGGGGGIVGGLFTCSEKLQVVLVAVLEEFVSLYVALGLSILITAVGLHTFTTSKYDPESILSAKKVL